MSRFFVLVFCLSSFIVSATSQESGLQKESENENSWKMGTNCSNYFCQDRKGYFDQNSFYIRSYFPYISFKLLYSMFRTNFVLYIRNIQKPSTASIKVCSEWRCDLILNSEDRILTYSTTSEVILSSDDPSAKFDVQFFSGCNILDQKEISIDYDNSRFGQIIQPCWVIIPRLYTTSLKQFVALTRAVISEKNLPLNSTISMYNMITGENFANINNQSDVDWIELKPNNQSIKFQIKKSVSSVLFVEITNCQYQACPDMRFIIKLLAYSISDKNCIKKKEACLYGLVDEGEDECEDEDEQEINPDKCSAFDYFESLLLPAVTEDEQLSEDESARWLSATSKYFRRCKQIFRSREKKYFCRRMKNSELIPCSYFKRCEGYCLSLRLLKKICSTKSRLSVFL